jgi:hypothetical protein
MRKRYPGKFEACDDERLAEVLCGIETDSDCGEADTTGWYGLVLHRDHGYVISEDANGFFDYQYYETRERAQRAYDRIEAELFEDAGPQDDDITISDSGPLGTLYSVGVVNGKHIGEYKTREDAVNAIREYMEKNNWYPTVWSVSDHGNAVAINIGEE